MVNNLFQIAVAIDRVVDNARLMATQGSDLLFSEKAQALRVCQPPVRRRPPAVLPHAEDFASFHNR